MYILKNAFKNLGRNKGRNILLGIIIFFLILATTVALVINTTTEGIINDYKTRFGSKVTLSVDFDKLMAETKPNADGSIAFPSAPEISTDQYLSFSESDCLKSFQMDAEIGVVLNGLKAVDEQKSNGVSVSSTGGVNDDYVAPTAKIIGHTSAEQLTGFSDGTRKIMEGTLYKGNNECLISSEFAALNNLKVGDEFKITDSLHKEGVITVKVSGIYADATKPYGDLPEGVFSLGGSYMNRRNEILVSMETMTQNVDTNSLIVNAQYELTSPNKLEAFEKELRAKGLPDAYNVETDEASYNRIVAPVLGLSQISMTFMWVILGIGGVILLFVTTMAIRERKYEIGVLRAMGMKKIKVATMLIMEIVMITTLCLAGAFAIGSAISQPVADSLIAGQVEAAKNGTQGNQMSGSTMVVTDIGGGEKEEPLSEIDVSLTPEAAMQICFVALTLTLLSSAAGVIFITKYEPIKILSERN